MKVQGLGRGLSVLINSEPERVPLRKKENNKIEKKEKIKISVREERPIETEYKYIPLNKIEPNPFQPRKEFDEIAIDELSQAIAQSGFISPLIVNGKNKNGEYTLVAGERRLRACKKLGLAEIPAIIRSFTDAQMMQIAIIENVQRKNLNPIEEAKAYKNMQDKLGLTAEEIGRDIGIPHYYVVQKLKLTNLPESIQGYVSSGELIEGSALELLRLESPDAMIAAARMAIRQHMSRKSVEKLVDKILMSKGHQVAPNHDLHYRAKYQYIVDAFKDTLGWKMNIKGGANGSGKIEIEFLDELNLKDIYNKLENILK